MSDNRTYRGRGGYSRGRGSSRPFEPRDRNRLNENNRPSDSDNWGGSSNSRPGNTPGLHSAPPSGIGQPRPQYYPPNRGHHDSHPRSSSNEGRFQYRSTNGPSRARPPHYANSRPHSSQRNLNDRIRPSQSEIDQRRSRFSNDTLSVSQQFTHISRSDNAENSLVERKNQRTLYDHIKQQIQKVSSSTQSIEAYDPIIRDFRKLREGVYASRLFDDFAVEVYEKSIEMSLLGQNFAELIKATTGLLDEVYPHLEKSNDKPPRNLAETTKYHLLYHICYINSPSGRSTSLRLYTTLPKHLQKSSHVDFAMQILMCVVRRDYIKFMKFYTSAQILDRIFLDAILPSFRDQTFKILRKAYYQIPLKFLHQTLFFNISCNANSEPVRNQQQKEQGEKASSVSKPQVTEGDNTVSAQEEESGSEKENVYDEVLSYLDDQGLNVNECVKNGVVYFKAIRK